MEKGASLYLNPHHANLLDLTAASFLTLGTKLALGHPSGLQARD